RPPRPAWTSGRSRAGPEPPRGSDLRTPAAPRPRRPSIPETRAETAPAAPPGRPWRAGTGRCRSRARSRSAWPSPLANGEMASGEWKLTMRHSPFATAQQRLAASRARAYIAGASAPTEPTNLKEFEIRPDPDDPRLSVSVPGIDHEGQRVETSVVTERPLTLYLNGQEIVTMMTIGDRPELLAVGYLLNQNMLTADDEIAGVDYDDDIATVVVRTGRQT